MQPDIAIDVEDKVYISDPSNHKIKKFTADGKPITSWELTGTEGFGSAPPLRIGSRQ